MQVPIGRSGVQAVPNTLHSHGLIAPMQHLAALAGLRVGDRVPRAARSGARRPVGEPGRDRSALCWIQPRPRHSNVSRSSSSPRARRARGVALARHDAGVLVLDLAASLAELAHRMQHRLQMSSGSKPGDDDGLPYSATMNRRPASRSPSRRDRRDEGVELEAGRVEDRPQRRPIVRGCRRPRSCGSRRRGRAAT